MLELYKNIKKKREELGLSQDDLAQQTGYTSRSSIAKIEKGIVDLPQTKIKIFASALKTSPQELMGWITDSNSLLDYFEDTFNEITSFLEKSGYEVIVSDSWSDNTVVIKNNESQIIKTTTSGDLVGQYEHLKMNNLPRTIENILNIVSETVLPENIRTAARGIMDLSPKDQETAFEMINYLIQKGKEEH